VLSCDGETKFIGITTDGVRKGVYYWLKQVRPAPNLHAKTSEVLWYSVPLNCCDWILLSVCIGQNKPAIIRPIYEDCYSLLN